MWVVWGYAFSSGFFMHLKCQVSLGSLVHFKCHVLPPFPSARIALCQLQAIGIFSGNITCKLLFLGEISLSIQTARYTIPCWRSSRDRRYKRLMVSYLLSEFYIDIWLVYIDSSWKNVLIFQKWVVFTLLQEELTVIILRQDPPK